MEVKIKTPLKDVKRLKVGNFARISGTVYTARDRASKYLLEAERVPFDLKDSIIYHCGPLVRNNEILCGGPTTSARMNSYTPKLIEKYGIKGIIGKGGMNSDVSEALKRFGAVYFSAIGGAAVFLAKSVKVKNVYKEEFGPTEAIWELEVRDFPAIVTMDSKGESLHQSILKSSKRMLL